MIPTNEKKLVEIFSLVLDLDTNSDVFSLRRLSEPNWDSLAHVSIVAAVESEFGLIFDSLEMERMTSFASTKLLLEEKGL